MRRLLLLFLLPGLAFAADGPASFVGDWSGALSVGGAKLRLVVHLKQETNGRWRGTMDSVDQSAMGIPIDSILVDGSSLRFFMNAIHGSYEGKLSDDGSEVQGTWTQGVPLPLVFKRSTGELPTLSRPQEPKAPFPYDTENVTYPNGAAGVTIAGTLTIPRSAGPHPAVLLISGSGPQNRDEQILGHKPFWILADHLTRQGIVVLRVDDRGIGESTGDFAAATTEDFASDALAGVEFLKQRAEVDPAQIGLVGHSEGGVIAPMVAARSKDVAFIVLMAGVGVNMETLLRTQSRLILKSAGLDDAYIELNDETIGRVCAIVRAEPNPEAAKEKIRAVIDDMLSRMTPAQKAASGATPETLNANASMINTPWFRFLLDYDPIATLRKVKQPVLAINGSLDMQVPPAQNLPAIAKALAEGDNHAAETAELPNLNHLFQTAATGAPAEYAQIEETISPVALKKISDWILARTKSAKK